MANMNLNFSRGINKILSEVSTNGTLKKSALNLMNKILGFLNSKLVNYCLDNNKEDIMNVLTCQNAVEEIFSGELKRLAFAEGGRNLSLYSNGLVEYIPQIKCKTEVSVKRKIVKKNVIATAASELSRGICNITSLIFPDASLQAQTKTIICELIAEFVIKFSDLIRSRSKKSIMLEDVKAASSQMLPQEILRLAHAEGARVVSLYEAGILEEPIARKKAPLRKITRKKRVKRKAVAQKVAKARKISKSRRVSRRAATIEPKKRRVARKRKRSASEISSKSPKRRRKPSGKITRKKRATSKAVAQKVAKARKISKSRRVSRRAASREPKKRRVARKRKLSASEISSRSPKRRRKPSRKVSKDKTTKIVSRRKRGISRKKKAIARKEIASADTPLKLSKGICDITASLYPDASLQVSTRKIICEMIEDLAVKISDFIHTKGKNSITQEDVRAASSHILSQEILKHALAEGARMMVLYETGMLQEQTAQRRAPVRKITRKKRASRKAITRKVTKPAVEPKKRRVTRKRERSPSRISPRSSKRRRKSSTKIISKKIASSKTRRKRPSAKVSRKISAVKPRRKAPSRKITRKKYGSRKTVAPKVSGPKVFRKSRRVSRRAASAEPKKQKVARKRKRSLSEISRFSHKRRSKPSTKKMSRATVASKTRQKKDASKVTRKRALSKKKVLPRKVARKRRLIKRKIAKPRVSRITRHVSGKVSKDKATKIVSPRKRRKSRKEKVTISKITPKITTTIANEISQRTKKLNKVYRQKLPPQTLKVSVEHLTNLFYAFIEEMKRSKSSIIGPEVVRQSALKIFPPHLADLAVAHMNQIIMT